MEEEERIGGTLPDFQEAPKSDSTIWKILAGLLFVVIVILVISIYSADNSKIAEDDLLICNTNLEATKSSLTSTSQQFTDCKRELETCLNPIIPEVIIEENITEIINVTEGNTTSVTNVTDVNMTDTNITGETNVTE